MHADQQYETDERPTVSFVQLVTTPPVQASGLLTIPGEVYGLTADGAVFRLLDDDRGWARVSMNWGNG